jgi:hypothetical protein
MPPSAEENTFRPLFALGKLPHAAHALSLLALAAIRLPFAAVLNSVRQAFSPVQKLAHFTWRRAAGPSLLIGTRQLPHGNAMGEEIFS